MYDLEKLMTEHPTHPRQIWLGLQHEKKARRYWAQRNGEIQEPTGLDDNKMITLLQASHSFLVSMETIRRWIRLGNITTEKVKGRRLVDQEELEAWVNLSYKTSYHLVSQKKASTITDEIERKAV